MSEKTKVAVYCRLAREPAPKAAIYCRVASASEFAIEAQEETLNNYAIRQMIDVGEVYSDNGEGGLTLDRPAFKKMMSGINRGEITCVIIKDFSRVSRNIILLGKWLSEMHEKRIRVIAVNDGYDSTVAQGRDIMYEQASEAIIEMWKEQHSAMIRAGIARKREADAARCCVTD